jgi:hypothetical protein
MGHAIASHACHIINNGEPSANQPIEEARLTHIGASNDRNLGKGHGKYIDKAKNEKPHHNGWLPSAQGVKPPGSWNSLPSQRTDPRKKSMGKDRRDEPQPRKAQAPSPLALVVFVLRGARLKSPQTRSQSSNRTHSLKNARSTNPVSIPPFAKSSCCNTFLWKGAVVAIPCTLSSSNARIMVAIASSRVGL